MPSLRDRVTANIMNEGTATLINRKSVVIDGRPLKACWARAQANRAQQFDADLLDNRPLYEVALPGAVFDAPTSLKVGSELTWVATGWQGVIRAIDPIDVRGVIVGATAIVAIVSEVSKE